MNGNNFDVKNLKKKEIALQYVLFCRWVKVIDKSLQGSFRECLTKNSHELKQKHLFHSQTMFLTNIGEKWLGMGGGLGGVGWVRG